MTDMNSINHMVESMRIASDRAKGIENISIGDTQSADFSDMLKKAIDDVNAAQMKAGQLTQAYERGDENVTLPDVMISLQKSKILFRSMLEVRNKMVTAYQDIMNMPV